MDVILHVGAHRTGSTTLQHFLQSNRTMLEGSGIGVWGPDRTRDGLFSGLIKAPNKLLPDDLRRGARSTGLIRIELQRLADAGLSTLIVSEENMIGSMENNIETRRLYPHGAERLERFVPGFGDRVRRVALAIRSPDRIWSSALAFYLVSGHRMPNPTALAALCDQPLTWQQVIRRLSRVFPQAELVVWTFEGLIGRPDAQLAALIGRLPDGPMSARAARHNASPPRRRLHAILEAQGMDGPVLARAAPGPGPWIPFAEAQVEQMRARYARDLDWLRAGADGLARFIEAPEPIPGAEHPTRGQDHDHGQGGLAQAGRQGIAGRVAR